MLTYIPSQSSRHWVIYQHTLEGQIAYIGCCCISELIDAPDAHRNDAWVKYVQPGMPIKLTILSTHTSEVEARFYHAMKLQEQNPLPPANKYGKQITDKTNTVIVCNETGETFKNALQAAKAHDLSISAIYNHLNGRTGHRTVKGRTYARVIVEQPEQSDVPS